jgi:hypothetical protein
MTRLLVDDNVERERRTVAWSNAPGFAISPDGRWLLYTSLESSDADLMFVDNFR